MGAVAAAVGSRMSVAVLAVLGASASASGKHEEQQSTGPVPHSSPPSATLSLQGRRGGGLCGARLTAAGLSPGWLACTDELPRASLVMANTYFHPFGAQLAIVKAPAINARRCMAHPALQRLRGASWRAQVGVPSRPRGPCQPLPHHQFSSIFSPPSAERSYTLLVRPKRSFSKAYADSTPCTGCAGCKRLHHVQEH